MHLAEEENCTEVGKRDVAGVLKKDVFRLKIAVNSVLNVAEVV